MSSRLVFSLLAVSSLAHAELPIPMIGRQSHNEGIRAVPAKGPVEIDGDLKEWDLSGKIWSFADVAIRDRYSVETSVMWDKEHLYIGQFVRDPNPLVNTIDPAFDPKSGWKGDAIQLRVLTDWPSWVTFWKHSPSKKSAMHIASWTDAESSKTTEDTLLISEPDSKELGQGVQMACKPVENGYIREIRIPWKVIYKNTPEISAGTKIRLGLELFWGRADESTWPAHRYTDNLQKGETSREFFWTAKRAWGDVTLLPEGNIEPLRYTLPGQKIEGSFPLSIEIPADAKEFTVVIETKDGKRIRNLGAQLDPELYQISSKDGKRTVEVLWDGADDHGKIVPPGEYKSRGLTHRGLGADYVMTFFNPGTPPWDTGGKGGWGADHGAPKRVAASGDWTIVAWDFAEGGHGVIGIGPDGLKKWGEKRGAASLAADDKSVYFMANSWHSSGNLCRLEKTNGTYKPFMLDGKERPFELPLTEIFGTDVPGKVTGLASSGKTLALAMSGGKVALLDPNSAKLIKLIDVPEPSAVAFAADEKLYALSAGKLVEITGDTLRAIATPGLAKPAETLTTDKDGNIGLLDDGPDQQIKFFTPDGKFSHALGKTGGRPIRGDFDEQAMSHVSSIATNSKDETWAAEAWEYPRRVSVWGRDGKLVRDYIGNTGYSGTGAFLHDQDPTLGYYGPVEMKIDMTKRTWKVTRILWVPGEGEHFEVSSHSHTHPHRFTSSAGGKKREYMFAPPYRNYGSYVVYMEDDKGWRPVTAVGTLGDLSGKLDNHGKVIEQPDGIFAGCNAWDAYFWNDVDKDGKVSRAEVTIIPNPNPVEIGKSGKTAIPLGSGWGTRMAPENFTFFTNGITRFTPVKFTEEGAPVFTPESIHALDMKDNGDFVPVPSEKTVIALTNRGNHSTTGLFVLDAETGAEKWSYPNPYPSVHGSHHAPMPQPGLLIGPLKILGSAELPDGGHFFGLRGNLGQDFHYTTDGLFIGTIFQDGRLPSMSLPSNEADLIGSPMESLGGGAEPFSGWFGKHNDGKVRFSNGIAGQASVVYEMKGLENVKRFNGPSVSVNEEALSKAAIANDARAAAARKGAEKKYAISRVTGAPEWKKIPAFNIQSNASNFKAKAQLACSEGHLHFAIDVEDPSPWKNEGLNPTRLFKTGDAVDLQLGTDLNERSNPGPGDLRLVFADLKGKPTAILMRPISSGAPDSAKKTYTSPVGNKTFDEVRPLETVNVSVTTSASGYRVEASVPLADIALDPASGKSIKGDIGFISSDAAGRTNVARTYWSNQATNLIADEPLEAWFNPSSWGTFEFK